MTQAIIDSHSDSDPSYAALQEEAERVRGSGVLGEARLRRLFDYLVLHSHQAQAPKEIAIAVDVFGKGNGFDASQDALVRVYIHKLRRALEDFYAERVANGGHTLHIPRGEYRLVVTTQSSPPARIEPAPKRNLGPLTGWIVAAAVGVVSALLLAVAWLRPHTDADEIRANPIWSWVLKDDRPIMVIVGDYYLIGETDDSMEVKRLIREYSVNSKSDLDRYVGQHPEVADKYMDVGLRYLPTAAAFALRDIMPILAVRNRRVLVNMMSDVNPAMLKGADIVYIGYLSGLGIMQNLVFAGSRFAIGDSFDELVDKKTKHQYISQTASQNMQGLNDSGTESPYRDYGFFSTFNGPGGNRIVVIAGTRDEGVRQTAEVFTNRTKLEDMSRDREASPPFEALLEVAALDGVNLTGKLLITDRLGAANLPCATCTPGR